MINKYIVFCISEPLTSTFIHSSTSIVMGRVAVIAMEDAWVTNKLSIIVRAYLSTSGVRWGKKESALEPASRVRGAGYHRQ